MVLNPGSSSMTNRTPARDWPNLMGWRERFVVPLKPDNAGGKGPQFKDRRKTQRGTWRLGNLINSGQRSETADGVARESEGRTRLPLLRHSTTRSAATTFWRTPMPRCRSNKGAPGVDRQDFEAVETYGVERWLGELALALQARDLPTGPYPDAFTYRRPTASSGRWAADS